jgi:hypothetical protein
VPSGVVPSLKLLPPKSSSTFAATEVDADTTASGHSKTTDPGWVGGQHVNVIESKFGRAVVRGEGGLDVAHNEQILPLWDTEPAPNRAKPAPCQTHLGDVLCHLVSWHSSP